MKRLNITVHIEPDGAYVRLTGRVAWALSQLLQAGEKGVTPIDTPGPRWSGYVHELRRLGIVVQTIHERHAGPFPGTHARYVLRSVVTIREGGAHEQAA